MSVLGAGPTRVVVRFAAGNQLCGWIFGELTETLAGTYLRKIVDKPVIVFVHHTLDDSDSSLLDADRFLRIVAAQGHVKAVFYGHSHEWKREVREGLHLVNLLAVGYNFADSEPVGWVEAEFSASKTELKLHAFGGTVNADGKEVQLE